MVFLSFDDDAPSATLQSDRQAHRLVREHREHGAPGLPPYRVLEAQILDVHADLPHLGEKPPEHAGLVGHEDEDVAVAARGAAVLSRNPLDALVSPADRLAHSREDAEGEGVVDSGLDGRYEPVEIGRDFFEHAGHFARVSGDDRGPQPRVGMGDPGDVAQALAGQAEGFGRDVAQRARHERGYELRHVRDDGGGAVVGLRAHDDGQRADRQGELLDGQHDVASRGPLCRSAGGRLRRSAGAPAPGFARPDRGDDPGSADEKVGVRRQGARALAPGHRVAADVAVGAGMPLDFLDDPRFDRGDVGHERAAEAVEALADDVGGDVGRGGDHHELGLLGILRGDLPGAQVARKRQSGRGRVFELNLDAELAQAQAQRRAEQA